MLRDHSSARRTVRTARIFPHRESVGELVPARRGRWPNLSGVEFRRIDALPPYAFAQINALKMQLRRAGEDVIDLGFGNPDLPSPDVAVEKLIEAVRNPRNHRYSLSNGIPKLREALASLYQRKFDVTLDFETEVCSTIGAKEGFSHLMLTLVGPGDTALVPSPSYPIHIWGPILAGAAIHYVRLGPEQDLSLIHI